MSRRGAPSSSDGGAVPGEILLEYTSFGAQVRVAAIDPATGVEVTLIVPAGVSESDIARLARRKLERRMAEAAPPPAGRPGRYA